MRQNFSSPTLSPLPPYPSSSPPKKPPATAPPSPEPVDFEPPEESVEGTDSMRATHIRPRNAPASPDRPGTAYSTRSTIRQVEPSPESLSDAFTKGFADSGTPAPEPSFEPFPHFSPSRAADTVADDARYTHIPSTEPNADAEAEAEVEEETEAQAQAQPGALRRGGTPSGRTSPRKSGSSSPQKSRSQSPRKHMVRTPTLPAHQESPSSTYSASNSEKWDAPDTPSPVSREQQRQVYAPLRVHRPFASANDAGEPVLGHRTHARIADYTRKMQMQMQQRSGSVKASDPERGTTQRTGAVQRVVAPLPHIVQAMAPPNRASETLSPFSAVQRHTQLGQEPARHTSVSRRSEASGASVASKHSIFSTPGRDEMERKKPIVEEDEGPFAKAKNVQDLERKRRTVSEGTRDGAEEDKKKFCGMKCLVM
ncbi:hypothetical protein SVAN01_08348 [Stagonosporopsis vannaccii]|nr:hypothetical protein SVAN01_08348 [Stagonosporopsis vannaccii]